MPFAVPPAITTRKPIFTPGMKVNWEHPLNRELAAWWLMNEGSGDGTIRDLVSGIVASPAGGYPTWQGSPRGICLNFAAAPYLTIPILDKLNIVGPITIVAWIYRSSTANGYIFYGNDTSNPYKGYTMGIGIGGTANCITYWNGVGWKSSTTTISTLAWHNIGVSGKGTTVQFALDGLDAGTQTLAEPTTWSGIRAIGGRSNDGNTPFNGLIADVRLYRVGFSVTNFQTEYIYPYGTPDNPRLI